MTVLGHQELVKALSMPNPRKRLFVTPLLSEKQVGEASIDIRLGTEFLTIKRGNIGVIDPTSLPDKADRYRFRHQLSLKEEFYLHPNETALAGTLEYFRFPDNLSAYVTSRSKWGRLGLVIATATAVHPGFAGTITLELVNHSSVPIVLYAGLLVAQMIFLTAHGANRYQGDLSRQVAAYPSESTKNWQNDIDFWVPSGSKPVLPSNARAARQRPTKK